ncbi:MAG TPA: imidazole glycerol phosphate synthase subunit HisH [Bacteriovoracaceae bacterium]|nr:imidazole glycerol phosphate synthase subunit HisH [Bacteriovoracaceae bacterium]
MIAIINNNMGNIKSVSRALDLLGAENIITSDVNEIKQASKLILPGVGNFAEASRRLRQSGLMDLIKSEALDNKKPLLGICLGMQLLFDKSYEDGENEGLGLIPGMVKSLSDRPHKLAVPHMGWNDLKVKESRLLKGIPTGECFYFVHSFEAKCDSKYISATTEYGEDVVAAVEHDNIYGVQFHPEKSQASGIQLIKTFVTIC